MEDFLTYDRLIAHHRNQVNVEPIVPHTLTLAYDDVRYDKMARELSENDDIVRVKTLQELNEDLRQAYNIIKVIANDALTSQLIRALSDSSGDIRELASRTFIQICKVKQGREFTLSKAYVVEIAKLFNDSGESIRKNAYDSLLYLSDERAGCEGVTECAIIEILVDKLLTEKTTSILKLTLMLIDRLCSVTNGPFRALTTPIIPRLKNLLDHTNSEIQMLAAQNLASLSFSYPGKTRVIDHNCVGPLADLILSDVSEVRTAALLALASLTIEKAAKLELIEGKYLMNISELLRDPDSQTRLNAVQLIGNLAEHPVAKDQYQIIISRLSEMEKTDTELISRFAEKAIAVITWKP